MDGLSNTTRERCAASASADHCHSLLVGDDVAQQPADVAEASLVVHPGGGGGDAVESDQDQGHGVARRRRAPPGGTATVGEATRMAARVSPTRPGRRANRRAPRHAAALLWSNETGCPSAAHTFYTTPRCGAVRQVSCWVRGVPASEGPRAAGYRCCCCCCCCCWSR